MKTIVVDTETSGLPLHKDSSIYKSDEWPHILQLSYMIYDDITHEILIEVNDYIAIEKSCTISEASYEVHGLTREFLQSNGIPIKDALHKFKKHMNSCDVVVGHNISFDKRMILAECVRLKIFLNMKNTYCTMRNTKDVCKIQMQNSKGETYYKYPSLSELHYYLFGHNIKKLHDASVDILICMRCYFKINYGFDIVATNKQVATFIKKIKL